MTTAPETKNTDTNTGYEETVAEFARRTRAECGLPERLEDPELIAKIARILWRST